MPEIYRTRDFIILYKGSTTTVTLDDELVTNGWRGGQGVKWAPYNKDELYVTRSDGLYAGVLIVGSDETSDQLTAMTGNQLAYRYGVIGYGGWLVIMSTYERYTYASRHGGGPLVPIEYHASDRLLFSLRGLLTKEDEWSLSGDPRAPNSYYIAFVCQAPTFQSNYYMTVQLGI